MHVRSTLSILTTFGVSLLLSSCSACTEQYDPRPNRDRIEHDMAVANAQQPKLTPEGEIPQKAPAASEAPADAAGGGMPGMDKFEQICAACHGKNGDGQSAAAAAMNPKPRNFHDAKWQDSVTDEHITKTIKGGGASVGLSATMPAWGAVLSDQDVSNLVKLIRSFKGK